MGVDQARDGMREANAGVAQEATPVARVMAALAQFHMQVEIEDAARAEEDRRSRGANPRPIGGEEQVGSERVAMACAHLVEPGRAGLLAHLEDDLDVVAQTSPARREHLLERREVDRVLALVVGRAAAVPTVALDRDGPGAAARRPLSVVAAHDIAVAVGQDGERRTRLDPLGEQEGAALRDRVVDDPAREAQRSQAGRHLIVQIGAQDRPAGSVLALGSKGDAARQRVQKAPVVERGQHLVDG